KAGVLGGGGGGGGGGAGGGGGGGDTPRGGGGGGAAESAPPPLPPTHFHASGTRFTHNSSSQSNQIKKSIDSDHGIYRDQLSRAGGPESSNLAELEVAKRNQASSVAWPSARFAQIGRQGTRPRRGSRRRISRSIRPRCPAPAIEASAFCRYLKRRFYS